VEGPPLTASIGARLIRASAPGADPAALASEPSGQTFVQALPGQLGLRLESNKGPMDSQWITSGKIRL